MKIISGGQTGADQAGLRAARRYGIPTGGTAPKGWATERGPDPTLADYGLTECDRPGYPARTERNVGDADLTLFFGGRGPGFGATYWAAVERGRPFVHVASSGNPRFDAVAGRLNQLRPGAVVNVAGNRASKMPDAGQWVEDYLRYVFRAMGFKELPL